MQDELDASSVTSDDRWAYYALWAFSKEEVQIVAGALKTAVPGHLFETVKWTLTTCFAASVEKRFDTILQLANSHTTEGSDFPRLMDELCRACNSLTVKLLILSAFRRAIPASVAHLLPGPSEDANPMTYALEYERLAPLPTSDNVTLVSATKAPGL
eukprot:TCALIF_06708-PA protein Name:"Protein of unknown function" AED:0.23 eAED:0.26 QI:0/0/0/0.5/1/1/2/0/156